MRILHNTEIFYVLTSFLLRPYRNVLEGMKKNSNVSIGIVEAENPISTK